MPRIPDVCRTLLASAVLATAMGSAGASELNGATGSIIQVSLDGSPIDVPLPLDVRQDGKLIVSNFDGQLTIGGSDGAILSLLNVVADPDPFLGYAIGVTDIGSPSLFGFVFGTPIVPTSPPGTVTSTFSVMLTDGGNGTVSIAPVAPGVPVDSDGIPEIHVVTDGFTLTNDGRDLGPAATGGGVHGPFSEVGPMPGPGPWTWLQINVTFQGSGGNDFYALSGSALKVETSGAPEPPTLLLVLAGLAGCARLRRLRLLTR